MAVAVAEVVQLPVLDGLDELVDERLAREDGDVGLRQHVDDLLAGRLEQVRLAQSDAAVEEQRVVGPPGRFTYGDAGGVRQAVARAGHERVERVAGTVDRRRSGLAGNGRTIAVVGRIVGFPLRAGQEADADESAGGRLGGFGEQPHGVPAAVGLLGRARHEDLEQPVLEAQRLELRKPRPNDVAAGDDDPLNDLLPEGTVDLGHLCSTFPGAIGTLGKNSDYRKTSMIRCRRLRRLQPSLTANEAPWLRPHRGHHRGLYPSRWPVSTAGR